MKWSRYVWNDCWVQAGREVRKNPGSPPGPIFYLLFAIFFLYVAFLFFAQGGFGIIMGLAVLCGIVRSLADR